MKVAIATIALFLVIYTATTVSGNGEQWIDSCDRKCEPVTEKRCINPGTNDYESCGKCQPNADETACVKRNGKGKACENTNCMVELEAQCFCKPRKNQPSLNSCKNCEHNGSQKCTKKQND